MAAREQSVIILGIPLDAHSSYLRGPAQAPSRIREALRCDSSNMWTEGGRDLGGEGVLCDRGDLALQDAPYPSIEPGVAEVLRDDQPLICLGADHSITYPVLRAFAKKYPDLTIVHFDAHPDLYHEFEGNRHSHACPFARIMEEKLARRLIQAGIRTMNAHQRQQAERFGVEVYEMRNSLDLAKLNIAAPVYVSFDMDVLDPAFAPGISHWEPGGMSVREAIAHIQSIPARVVGADIVEFNPARDESGRTAMVCAKILKELADKMLQ